MSNQCDMCANYAYDEEYDEYYCAIDLDEDEYYRYISDRSAVCPYFKNGDEYAVVKHQM
ncbi:MAG: hypothetical protein IJS80_03125 [Lachnospiraceae bacterium]|nr:hypothetical protein [Lachnospiraceae bacterium]